MISKILEIIWELYKSDNISFKLMQDLLFEFKVSGNFWRLPDTNDDVFNYSAVAWDKYLINRLPD
jgi:hypothetical protein